MLCVGFFSNHTESCPGKQALALAFFYITCTFTWLHRSQNLAWTVREPQHTQPTQPITKAFRQHGIEPGLCV